MYDTCILVLSTPPPPITQNQVLTSQHKSTPAYVTLSESLGQDLSNPTQHETLSMSRNHFRKMPYSQFHVIWPLLYIFLELSGQGLRPIYLTTYRVNI